MARISDMHKKWIKEPKYRKAYEALEEEFVMASAVIEARNRAGLTQEELARRMGTTQPVVARLESGGTRPSMRTLERLAKATGSRLLISFQPRDGKRPAGDVSAGVSVGDVHQVRCIQRITENRCPRLFQWDAYRSKR